MILFEDIIDNVNQVDDNSTSKEVSQDESNCHEHFDFSIKLTVTRNNEDLSDINVVGNQIFSKATFSYFGELYRNDFIRYVRLVDCYCHSCGYIDDYYIWVSIGENTVRDYKQSELKLDNYDVWIGQESIAYETNVIIEFDTNGPINPLNVYNFIKRISEISVKRNAIISFEEMKIKKDSESYEGKRTFFDKYNKIYRSYCIVATVCPYLCPEYKRPINEFTKLNDITDEMFLNFIFDYHQKYGNI